MVRWPQMLENPGGSFRSPTDQFPEALAIYLRDGDQATRYLFAERFCRGARVLDFGCGSGFGAPLLASAFKSYLGVDLDKEAISFAENVIGPQVPGTHFAHVTGDPVESLGSEKFDVIVCLEVIEHVHDAGTLIVALEKLVRPGGLIIISTPNGLRTAHNSRLFWNPYHIDEFSANELDAILNSKFAGVEWFCQYRFDQIDRIYSGITRQTLEGECKRGPRSIDRTEGTGGDRVFAPTPASIGWKVFLRDLYHRFGNYPVFYRIRALPETDFSKLYYGTIIMIAKKQSIPG